MSTKKCVIRIWNFCKHGSPRALQHNSRFVTEMSPGCLIYLSVDGYGHKTSYVYVPNPERLPFLNKILFERFQRLCKIATEYRISQRCYFLNKIYIYVVTGLSFKLTTSDWGAIILGQRPLSKCNFFMAKITSQKLSWLPENEYIINEI